MQSDKGRDLVGASPPIVLPHSQFKPPTASLACRLPTTPSSTRRPLGAASRHGANAPTPIRPNAGHTYGSTLSQLYVTTVTTVTSTRHSSQRLALLHARWMHGHRHRLPLSAYQLLWPLPHQPDVLTYLQTLPQPTSGCISYRTVRLLSCTTQLKAGTHSHMAHVPICRLRLAPAHTLDAAAMEASISHFTSLHTPNITPHFQRHSTLPSVAAALPLITLPGLG